MKTENKNYIRELTNKVNKYERIKRIFLAVNFYMIFIFLNIEALIHDSSGNYCVLSRSLHETDKMFKCQNRILAIIIETLSSVL